MSDEREILKDLECFEDAEATSSGERFKTAVQVTSSDQKNLAENLTMFEENDNKGAAEAMT